MCIISKYIYSVDICTKQRLIPTGTWAKLLWFVSQKCHIFTIKTDTYLTLFKIVFLLEFFRYILRNGKLKPTCLAEFSWAMKKILRHKKSMQKTFFFNF